MSTSKNRNIKLITYFPLSLSHRYIMTGSYNNFFKIFDRHSKREVLLEASKDIARPRTVLKPKKVWILLGLSIRYETFILIQFLSHDDIFLLSFSGR